MSTPVDANQRVRLGGNTRPEAVAANDRGRVPDSLMLVHMQLLLKRPAEREAALQRYIQDLHNPGSKNFHHWLTIAQIGRDYGLAQSDLAAITAWLRQAGFTVNTLYPGTTTIDFTGTAEQVRNAFHTEIHYLQARGARHIANMSDPEIPAALADAVHGIVSLHDFRPHSNVRPRPAYTSGSSELVAPADLATIYNLLPLFADGISGQGQTIVVIEDTDVYSTADWSTFRSAFGLSSYTSASFSQVHPAPVSGGTNCSDPGVVGNGFEREAEIDAEWASAAAPSATIVLASCADAGTTFGGFIALQNLISGASPPAIVSISYGECEAENGATANAAYNTLYEQGAALGTSIFVSAGDEGAASCDANASAATHGIGVNAFASTQYNVAVGGTDFGDSYAGTNSTYWSSSNNATYGSALSYVPEIPWNDSCASVLIATVAGYSTTYGSAGFCNSTTGNANFLTTSSGGGGPSGCATGSPRHTGVVSGTCAGYAKPSWQSGVLGIPSDGVRDLPDISLFAANGVWHHYYVYCDSDTADGGVACTGAPSGWSGAGGTSFGAPIMAGIQALVNQKTGSKQGNPNSVYYGLAAVEYGTSGSSICNSSNGNAVNSGCVFYDVTQGDMDVNCTGSYDCYRPSGTNGVLSTSTSQYAKVYGTAVGWDFATGIGTPNVENLVNGWNASDLSLTGGGSVTSAGLLSYSWNISNAGPQVATGVVISATLPAGFSFVAAGSSANCSQTAQVVSCTVGTLGIAANTQLTVMIQPGNVQTANLTFTVSDSNGELFPANDSVTTALALPPQESGITDGPLPPWAYALLGASLLGIAGRQRKGRALFG
ncbi:MAG: protease pro-enzyme activation domain-containing protein [Steroidobacterales bacterium]